MTCKEVAEFLMEYLDGELTDAARAEFERHLTLCTTCVNYLKSYQAAVQMGKATFSSHAAAEPVPEDLVQAILASRRAE